MHKKITRFSYLDATSNFLQHFHKFHIVKGIQTLVYKEILGHKVICI